MKRPFKKISTENCISLKNTNQLTIIMYHYVRELHDSRFPEIKGLTIKNFIHQLDYFEQYYTFVTMEDCLSSLESGKRLPQNSILLTFDDGYIDHYLNVFPILAERGIQGSFFPPAKTILRNCILDVNKIHFILASEENKALLLRKVYDRINDYTKEYDLQPIQEYIADININTQYDCPEVALIKCLLQRVLPSPVRERITFDLFNEYLGVSEKVFAKELYMTLDQIRMIKQYGMFIGGHGYDHVWMNTLSSKQQEEEINCSIEFLDSLRIDTNQWVFSYPYGAYNESLISLLKRKFCKLGLTTRVDIADLRPENAYILPRFDTNDFPCDNRASKKSMDNKNNER